MAERGHRRSARISALEASRAQQQQHQFAGDPGGRDKGILIEDGQDSDSVQELPVRRRGRKKRKLRTVEEVVVSSVERAAEQATENPQHEAQSSHTIEPSTLLSTSQKLDKRLCELIIDILQARDRRNIFGRPVGPEVEHYYEIIKQPMDFGTMKTKLQNGMYKTLEDFKGDILLISSNAMHFNDQNSFYFKQGYLNYQLAMRLFAAAKAHPENYEEALSRLRPKEPKVGRRPGSRCRLGSNERRNRINSGTSRRGRPCLYGPSSLGRNIQPSNYENSSGVRDGRRSSILEEGNRRLSKPWNSFLSQSESIASIVYESSKQLLNVNSGGIGYGESLLRYAKDLGPTAQKVAKQKLLAYQASARNGHVASTSTQRRPNPPHNIINTPTSQNRFNNFSGLHTLPNPSNNVIDISNSQSFFNNLSTLPTLPKPPHCVINIPPSQKILNNFSGVPTIQSDLTNIGEKFHIRGAFRGETSQQNQISETRVGSQFPITSARDLKFPVNGMANSSNGYFSKVDPGKIESNPSAESASEMSQLKLLEYMCRQNNISRSSSSCFQAMMEDNSSRASSSRNGLGSHSSGAENQALSTPGSSYRNSPIPKWNQSSMGLHSLGVEQNQARVAPSRTFGTSSAPFGHVMEWNGPSLGTSSFGGENLAMAAPGPSLAVGLPEADPVLEWNRANSGSHTLNPGNQTMDAPGVTYEIKSGHASLGAHSLSATNQEMAASSSVFGTKSAQASSIPDWDQLNFGSPFLGGENQSIDVSGCGYGMDLGHGGSVSVSLPIPTPILEWNQQRGNAPQSVIDMEFLQNRLSEMNTFDQNGFCQPEWRLGSIPGTALGQMGYCGRVQTHYHQTELNTLAIMDNHQQPDLALQL